MSRRLEYRDVSALGREDKETQQANNRRNVLHRRDQDRASKEKTSQYAEQKAEAKSEYKKNVSDGMDHFAAQEIMNKKIEEAAKKYAVETQQDVIKHNARGGADRGVAFTDLGKAARDRENADATRSALEKVEKYRKEIEKLDEKHANLSQEGEKLRQNIADEYYNLELARTTSHDDSSRSSSAIFEQWKMSEAKIKSDTLEEGSNTQLKLEHQTVQAHFLASVEGGAHARTLAMNFAQERGEPKTETRRLQRAADSAELALNEIKSVHPEAEKDIEQFQKNHSSFTHLDRSTNNTKYEQHKQEQETKEQFCRPQLERMNRLDGKFEDNLKDLHEAKAGDESLQSSQEAKLRKLLDALKEEYEPRLKHLTAEAKKQNDVEDKNFAQKQAKLQNETETRERTVERAGGFLKAERYRALKEDMQTNHDNRLSEINNAHIAKQVEIFQPLAREYAQYQGAIEEAGRLYPQGAIGIMRERLQKMLKEHDDAGQQIAENRKGRQSSHENMERFAEKAKEKSTDWTAEKDLRQKRVLDADKECRRAEAEHILARRRKEDAEILWTHAEHRRQHFSHHVNELRQEYQMQEQIAQYEENPFKKQQQLRRAAETRKAVLTATNELKDLDNNLEKLRENHKSTLNSFHASDAKYQEKAQELQSCEREFEIAKTYYDSEEKKRYRYEDNMREEDRATIAYLRLQRIQDRNNRALILSQLLGDSSSAIQAHTMGNLNNLLTALSK